MPEEIRLWTVAPDDAHGQLVEVARSDLDLEARLQTWVRQDPSVIADDLLLIGEEVPTDAGGRIDLLGLDASGTLVIIELKRGQTPREVTAQALDYGAWAHHASSGDITRIAEEFLGRDLDAAFQDQFGEGLPEYLGESHRMLIVGATADDRTERIVTYLSEVYGVDINVLSFSFFVADGRELLGRTFLLEPERVEQQTQRRPGAKRLPNLTRDQLRSAAVERGLAEDYDRLVTVLNRHLRFDRTRSAAAFKAKLDGSYRATFNVIATESDTERGLKFIAYASRLAAAFGTSKDAVHQALPADAVPWAYQDYESTPEDWRGYEGFMQSGDVDRFVSWLGSVATG